MSVIDIENCCSECFNAAPFYSLSALISSYPIFDQVVLPGPDEESGKYYCEDCYLLKFDKLFFPLTEKGLWFSVVKEVQNDPLLVDRIMKNQYASCPLCGDDWDEQIAMNYNTKTKKFFDYIYRKNGVSKKGIRNFPLLKMICMKCAGKRKVPGYFKTPGFS